MAITLNPQTLLLVTALQPLESSEPSQKQCGVCKLRILKMQILEYRDVHFLCWSTGCTYAHATQTDPADCLADLVAKESVGFQRRVSGRTELNTSDWGYYPVSFQTIAHLTSDLNGR